jgi:hypothetical protein
MTGPLRVAVAEGFGAGFANAQAAVWASLPVSLFADPDDPQLLAVDGRSTEWPAAVRRALDSAVLGVVVVRPGAGIASSEVRALAEEVAGRATAVVVESAWASHPAVADARTPITERVSDGALFDSLAAVAADDRRTLADVLVEHLAFVRAAWAPLDEVRFSARDERGYTVGAAYGSCVVVMSGVRSSAARAGVRFAAYGASGEAHLAVPDDGTAAPAQAWFVDGEGMTTRPSWYESASRFTWRRLRDAVRAGGKTSDLALLADDLEVAAGL